MEHILNALSISINSVIAKQACRSTYNVARTLTMFIVDFLKGYDVDVQNVIMEKVVGHDILTVAMPPYLHDIKRLKQNLQLIENFKFGLNHVASHQPFKLILAKDSICTLASFQSIRSSQETTKILGVDKRNIKKGVERCVLLEALEIVFWTHFKHAKRSNVLFVHFV